METQVSKGRGRPKKVDDSNIPAYIQKHVLSDVEVKTFKFMSNMDKFKIRNDFKEYLQEGLNHNQTLINISKLYDITYKQAYEICI